MIENLGSLLYSGTKADRKSDSLGSSADGTNTGIVNQNFSSNGIYLDGGNVDFTATGLFDGTGDFSIAFWVKPTDVSSNRSLFFTNGTGSGIFQVFYTTSSGGTWRINLDGSDDVDFALTLNSWNHVVITKTSVGVWTVYVNKTAGTPVTNNVTLTSGTTYRLGQSYDASYPEYYKGYIQQFLIYDDVLTQTEVNTLYDLGRTSTSPSTSGLVSQYNLTSNANDSQGSNNGTASGIKLGTGAYSFDGSNDYVQTSTKFNYLHDGTGGSIAFWMKPRNMSSIHGNGDIIFDSMATSAGNGTGIQITLKNTTLLRVNFTTSGDQWFTDVNSTTTFSDDTWYHIALTFGSNTVKLYVNGTLEDTETFSNPNTNASNGNFTIGRHATDPTQYGYYDGVIDSVGIWKRVITATEIGKLANNNDNGGTGWTASDTAYIKVSDGAIKYTDGGNYNYQTLTYDLGSALSNTQWTMRLKANFSGNASSDDPLFAFVLTDAASNTFNRTCDVIGVSWYNDRNNTWARNYSISKVDGAGAGQSNSSPVSNDYTKGTDYYVQVERTSATAATVKVYTDPNFSTQHGSSIVMDNITSSLTGLRYIVAQDHAQGAGMTGTIDDVKIWDGTNTTSGTPDHSFTFTAGDAQLVSSLTNKSELKAYYSMDSTSLGASASDLSWNTSDSSNFSFSATDNANQKATTGGSASFSNSRCISTKGHTASASTSGEFSYNLSVESGSVHDWMVGLTSTPTASVSSYINEIWVVGHYQSAVNGNNKVYVGTTQGSNYATNTATTKYTLKISGLDVILQYNGEDKHTFSNALTSGSTYYLIGSGSGGAGNGFTFNDEGCKNDFSSTSALEALSGVRTSSIFQQTDDTPSYWWYNGTSWRADGTNTPKQIDGLYAWYDASDSSTITKDGSNKVSKWTDKSGNSLGSNLDLLQSTGGDQPTWTDADRNGKPTLNFSGAYMKTDTSVTIASESQPTTYFFVTKTDANGERVMLDGSYGSNSNYDDWRQNMGKSGSNYWFVDGGTTSTTASADTWYYGTAIFNGSSGKLNINGTTISSSLATGSRQMRMGTLGSWSDGSSSQRWEGKFAEIIMFNKLLSDTEIADVEEYLKEKWGF